MVKKSTEAAIIVPTLNAAATWPQFREALMTQAITPQQVLIVDSASTDGTLDLARQSDFRAISIAREDFNHGGTRQWAIQFFPNAEIILYLTQDAVLAEPNAIRELTKAFDDAGIGAAYGRQLPRIGASPIEAHGRFFNYPDESDIRTLEGRQRLGLKAIFISNSFAAYRRSALESVGGFPADVIFGEDTITAARLLLKGWQIAYVASARVYHSHAYSVRQEFQRYFDIGVLHSREADLIREFGGANNEGKRFVLSELNYLWPRNAALIPLALLRTVAKMAGYRLGRYEAKLSPAFKQRVSMHHRFWKTEC